uniref:Uncharacterized protein n=1 Tax=Arundo donax TaxID=35708 RepID=A0A0A8YE01_ARUDO
MQKKNLPFHLSFNSQYMSAAPRTLSSHSKCTHELFI